MEYVYYRERGMMGQTNTYTCTLGGGGGGVDEYAEYVGETYNGLFP